MGIYIRWTDCKSCDGSVTQSQTPSTYLYAAPKRPPKTCQKKTEKEEGDALAPRPTHPRWVWGVSIIPPYPQANPHPPMPRNQHLLSSLPRMPVCHHRPSNTTIITHLLINFFGFPPNFIQDLQLKKKIWRKKSTQHSCLSFTTWHTRLLSRYNIDIYKVD